MIKINNLLKIFNKNKSNEVRAINDVSVEFPEKGLVAIYGASGSGKTTLMNALGGLDKFDGGEIIMDGNVYKKSVDDEYRIENIGYVFQNYLLDEKLNVYQNVAQGLRTIGIKDEEVIFKRVMVALDNVGMRDYFKRNITTLSGGQQQRVAIARAMVKGAKIILADEPTGNLDEINTRIVMDLLKAMSINCLVIVVTHEGDLIDKYADSVIEIRDGKVQNLSEGGNIALDAADKTKIFLGDKTKKDYVAGNVEVEYFGDEKPVKLTLVNHGGKLYLTCESGKVNFIDGESEISLVRKSKKQYEKEQKEKTSLAINDLGAIESGKAGNVFGFKKSFKEGVANAFGKNKKKVTLFTCAVILFMIATIFLLGSFGASYYSYQNLGGSYNPRRVDVFVDSLETQTKILDLAKEKGYKIDYSYYSMVDLSIQLQIKGFESITDFYYNYGVDSIVFDSYEKAKESKLLAGSKKDMNDWDKVAISKAIADRILDNIEAKTGAYGLGYDFVCNSYVSIRYPDERDIQIVAVVDSDEDCFYFEEVLLSMLAFRFSLDREYGLSAEDGEIIVNSVKVLGVEEGGYYDLYGKNMKVRIDPAAKEICLNENEILSLAERYDGYKQIVYLTDNADEFAHAIIDKGYSNSVISRDIVASADKFYALREVAENGIVLAVFFVLMLIAVALMFYASLATRVKEIGLYRAIGVSKKNILYKFFVEALALLLISVVSVYVVIGLPILIFSQGAVLYLQWWLYLASFVVISAAVIFFAVLPVMIYMRKSPVQILAKYDV